MGSITEFMANDHDRLDGIFGKFRDLKSTELKKAKLLFNDFTAGLRQHIAWEEEILFPICQEPPAEAGGVSARRLKKQAVLEHVTNALPYSRAEARGVSKKAFETFEDATGMRDEGPTAVMRIEHQQIKGFLEKIHAALSRNTISGVAELENQLLEVLTGHNEKEEGILYPLIDSSAGEMEKEEALEKMTSIL